MKTSPTYFKKLTGFLALAFILPLLVSCSSKPEDAIVGKWNPIDDTETMDLSGDESIEFFKDGTLVTDGDVMNLAGEFKFVDTNRIKVQFGGLGAFAFVVTVAISGDEMTWTMSDGKVGKFKRSK